MMVNDQDSRKPDTAFHPPFVNFVHQFIFYYVDPSILSITYIFYLFINLSIHCIQPTSIHYIAYIYILYILHLFNDLATREEPALP